jgi:hypothetical protein
MTAAWFLVSTVAMREVLFWRSEKYRLFTGSCRFHVCPCKRFGLLLYLQYFGRKTLPKVKPSSSPISRSIGMPMR